MTITLDSTYWSFACKNDLKSAVHLPKLLIQFLEGFLTSRENTSEDAHLSLFLSGWSELEMKKAMQRGL